MPPTPQAVVELAGIVVQRQEGERQFRLEIEEFILHAGELMGVVGASGSGKSTLLDLLGLILPPAEQSTFRFAGEEIRWHKGSLPRAALLRRKIGFVLQHGALLPFFSVQQNILLGAELAQQPVTQEALQEILEELRLRDIASALPAKISGGQRQRAALARALLSDPVLLLADEPTGSVDARQADEIGHLLARFTKVKKTATVLVTHDEALARSVSDRILRIIPDSPRPGLTQSRLSLVS